MVEVVAALIWDNDKFMICQRPAHKVRGLLWEFVGGKVELGETKKEALIRECREDLAVAEGNTEGGRRIDEYFVADGVHLNTEGNKRLYTLFMTDFPWLENL